MIVNDRRRGSKLGLGILKIESNELKIEDARMSFQKHGP